MHERLDVVNDALRVIDAEVTCLTVGVFLFGDWIRL
jgi:hypothetical protein